MDSKNLTGQTNCTKPADAEPAGPAAPVIRYPDVLLDFACKCGACRRTCCTRRDWDISMSQAERDAALVQVSAAGQAGPSSAAAAGARPAELAELLAGMGPCGDGRLAMPAKADGTCAMLDDEGRCAWRVRQGDDLCAVCREFPVMYLRLFGDVYACSSGACEAVLETLLRKRGRIEMRERTLGPDEAVVPRGYLLDVADVYDTPRVSGGRRNLRDTVYGYYPVFVRLGLDVLQDDSLSLDARVATLVTCLDVAAKMDQIGQCSRLEAALGSMLDGGRPHALAEGFARAARRTNPAVRVCSELFFCCVGDPSGSYAPMARRVLDGLGFTVFSRNPNPAVRGKLRLTDEGMLDRGRARCHEILGGRTDFFAKVMAGVYLHNGVPLASPDPWANARFFALCYALVKFGVAGYFNVSGGAAVELPSEPGTNAPGTNAPGDDELIDFLVIVLRAFVHNGGFYRNALRLMNDLKLTEAEDIVCMAQW